MEIEDVNVNETLVDEPAVTEEPEVEEIVTDDTVVDEPTDDTVDDESITEEPVVTEKPKANDSIPLAKYMAEKKKRQEYEQILAQQATEREKVTLTTDYMQRGWPEVEAVLMAKKDIETKAELERLSAKVFERETLGDIRDLAKSSDFYSDAETYADEIKDKMKSLNISAKDAYMLLRGEARTHEVRQKQEQLNAVKRKQVVSKKVATATPTLPSSPYKLDDHDKKALAMLQKAQPDAGWSIEKYYKLMKS